MACFKIIPALIAALCLLGSCREHPELAAVHGISKKVEIRKSGNHYQMYRNGEPYFIKGACGSDHLEALKKAGGNSFRTYDTQGLDTLLDQAEMLGLTVMAGIWVGREREGFDYGNKLAVRQQKERIRAIVERYKDHPALLCWAVGNEPDNADEDTDDLWPAINDLIRMIHELDPDHPVTVPVYPESTETVLQGCPDVDFLSFNIFGGLTDFSKKFRKNVPFVYTEWGILGGWESPATGWYAGIEESVKQKYERIYNTYHRNILPDSARCMGSYIFYWGQKQEYTPTWFSFFTKTGEKTALVDLMTLLWGGASPVNEAPFLDSLLIEGRDAFTEIYLNANTVSTATVLGIDPEMGPLSYHWEVLPDGQFFTYIPGRGKVEIAPEPIPGLILENKGPGIVFKTPPHTGAFRLMVYATDDQGYVSYANLPFFNTNDKMTPKLE